jgi:hypothetical protein
MSISVPSSMLLINPVFCSSVTGVAHHALVLIFRLIDRINCDKVMAAKKGKLNWL